MPDTSVLIDGRITELVQERFEGADVLVPLAALAELEAQANRGLETGFAGLHELQELQRLATEERCTVRFVGERPSSDEIERAATGAIDARIRDTAVEHGAMLVTSDRVQGYAAAAQGVRHHYVRPIVEDAPIEQLAIWGFFDDETTSVHLKADCRPMVKRGKPGEVRYEEAGVKAMGHPEVRAITQECIEFAKRDYQSFIELERHGCTVVQLGPMRITIAQPPFSDGLEVTAVRPIHKATLDDYDLPPDILDRIEGKSRGVFVAGPPGSGKSTFAAAVAEHLHAMSRVVKTMESPRDLQVPREITQYGALDRDMAWTGEVMLLVRPDHVIYDEVRTSDDFRTFADMRLAGIGLFGVTHANRAIDAVQRLIGRVDLGMIPQVVDTVCFVDDGQIATILELRFTVKVPAGIESEDLARPVVEVIDVSTGGVVYELYTFGEQIVVMPLDQVSSRKTGASAFAERQLKQALRRHVQGPFDVEMRGNRATVYAESWAVPGIIGKGGRTVQGLEARLGIKIDVKSRDVSDGPIHPKGVKRTGSNVFIILGADQGSRTYEVRADDGVIGEARASNQGKIRFKGDSPEGKALVAAQRAGAEITLVPV